MNSPAKKALIYSTYHPDGHLGKHVTDQLSSYADLGLEIFVVDTSGGDLGARKSFCEKIGATFLPRKNTGYDFTSYKYGLQFLEKETSLLDEGTSILLANDSCFGPLFPLQDIFDKLERYKDRKVCVGLTDSHLRKSYHLQSYWLYIESNATPALLKFFELMPEIEERDDAIEHGELALSAFLRFQKVKLVPLYTQEACADAIIEQLRFPYILKKKYWVFQGLPKPEKAVKNAVRRHLKGRAMTKELNPSISLMPVLVDQLHCPFVKIQRLRDDLFRCGYWDAWSEMALDKYPVLKEQCEDYLVNTGQLKNIAKHGSYNK